MIKNDSNLPLHLPARRLDHVHHWPSLRVPNVRGTSAVYRAYDEERRLLYIGRSAALRIRLDDHRRVSEWWPLAAYLAVSLYRGQRGCEGPEAAAIYQERPPFNAHVPRQQPSHEPPPPPQFED